MKSDRVLIMDYDSDPMPEIGTGRPDPINNWIGNGSLAARSGKNRPGPSRAVVKLLCIFYIKKNMGQTVDLNTVTSTSSGDTVWACASSTLVSAGRLPPLARG